MKKNRCGGYETHTPNGSDYDCEYQPTIDCSECKYCENVKWGKDPEAKCNQQKRN